MAELEPWRTNGKEYCEFTRNKMDYGLRVLSSQMKRMGSILTVYTSYNPNENCNIKYPHIKQVYFNATQLMIDYEMRGVVEFLRPYSLGEQNYARVSDMVRILLALKYGGAYIDLDIVFTNYNLTIFQRPFVATHIWGNVTCAMEITNAAFCLTKSALNDMRLHIINRVLYGTDMYIYTELGPLMFTKVLINKYPIYYYSVNHPEIFEIDAIIEQINDYHHQLLHLTSSLRLLLYRSGSKMEFSELIDMIIERLDMPPLNLPVSALPADYDILAIRAYYYNQPTLKSGVAYYHQLYNHVHQVITKDSTLYYFPSVKDALIETYRVIEVILTNTAMSTSEHQSAKQIHDNLKQLESYYDKKHGSSSSSISSSGAKTVINKRKQSSISTSSSSSSGSSVEREEEDEVDEGDGGIEVKKQSQSKSKQKLNKADNSNKSKDKKKTKNKLKKKMKGL